MPYIKCKKKVHIQAVDDAIGSILPASLINICSDYEYDSDSERLLGLVSSDQEESVILKELCSIIKHGAPVSTYAYILNRGDTTGATPLMYAADRGHRAVAQELMDKGADIEACDKNGQNALMFAAYHGHAPLIKTILEQAKKDKKRIPPLINKQDSMGDTPLIQAIRSSKAMASSKVETVRVLLEYGADTTLQASPGLDALWYADTCLKYNPYESARKRIVAMLENPRPLVQPTENLSLEHI